MGLATVLGLARRGFFIPYRYAADTFAAGERPDYAPIAELFAGHRDAFAAVLDTIDSFAEDLLKIGAAPAPGPRWTQDWFPRLDAACAYALVRVRAPKRIVEVGAGHSTRFAAQAVRDGGIKTEHVAIDPAPRASLDSLPLTLVRKTVQSVGVEAFAALEAGDFLMIDSSHILMPGTDVDLLLGRVLPALPAGVLVHVHDIFLPGDYPPDWAWRGYNEQLGVAALLHGGAFEPVFASAFVTRALTERIATSVIARLPLPGGAFESSLWMRKVAPPR